MTKPLALLAALALLAVAATDAHAQAPGATVAAASAPATPSADGARWDRRVGLHLHGLSFGAPAGTFAAEVEVSPLRWLSFSLGTGAAVGGQQWAGMVRVRGTTDGAFAGGVGAGVSNGPYEEWLALFGEPDRREDVTWANGEAFVEVRGETGLQVRIYAGATTQLDEGRCVSGEYLECDDLPSSMPYVGTAFGVAF